jgi:hypothetical protein
MSDNYCTKCSMWCTWSSALVLVSQSVQTCKVILYNLVKKKAKFVHNFFYYVYFFTLHVSGDCVPIIRRDNCIYATIGNCHCVWMTVWYAGCCIADSHPHSLTNTKSRIDKVISPEVGHIIARNM